MKWFGSPWPSDKMRAPICENDADRIPVPVGEPCVWCEELIDEHDRGESIGQFYAHLECMFRQVLGGPGHIQGRCICCGGTEDPDLGMSPREAAKWVWEHYNQPGGWI